MKLRINKTNKIKHLIEVGPMGRIVRCMKCKMPFLNLTNLTSRVRGNYRRDRGLLETVAYNKEFTLSCDISDKDYKFRELLE